LDWFPLSPIQDYLWRSSQVRQSFPDMNVTMAVLVPSCPDVDGLAVRLGRCLRRHGPLAARFQAAEGDVRQSASDEPLAIRVVDAASSSSAAPRAATAESTRRLAWFAERGIAPETAEAVATLSAAEKEYAFDLRTEAPTRVSVIRDGGPAATVVFNAHHIAIDAHAMGRILQDIDAAARGESALADVDLSYFQYAGQQAEVARERAPKQAQYWSRLLASADRRCEVPFFDRPTALCEVVERTAPIGEQGPQPQAAYFAAFARALDELGRRGGVHILSTLANRRPALESDTVGCYFKHVVFSAPDDPSALSDNDLKAHFAVQALRTYQNVDVTLDTLLEAARDDAGRYPAVDVGLNVRDLSHMAPGATGAAELAPLGNHVAHERLGAHLHLTRMPGEMRATLVHRPDWLSRDLAEALVDRVLHHTAHLA